MWKVNNSDGVEARPSFNLQTDLASALWRRLLPFADLLQQDVVGQPPLPVDGGCERPLHEHLLHRLQLRLFGLKGVRHKRSHVEAQVHLQETRRRRSTFNVLLRILSR